MKRRIRRISMVVAVVMSVALLLQTSSLTLWAQPPVDEAIRSLTVTGEGRVRAQPNEALVRFGVETEAQQAAEALMENNEGMQSLINALLEQANIDEQDISTQVLTVHPQYSEPSPTPGPMGQPGTMPPTEEMEVEEMEAEEEELEVEEQEMDDEEDMDEKDLDDEDEDMDVEEEEVAAVAEPAQMPETAMGMPQATGRQLIGYTATNVVQVRVRDLANMGEIIDLAVESGANRVEGIRFEITDRSTLLDQAREAAWADAMQKAEHLAELADVELGAVFSIDEFGTGAPFAVEFEEAAFGRGGGAPVQPGTQEVSVQLRVVWELE